MASRGLAARVPPLPQNDIRSTAPGWTREREGVRVQGTRGTTWCARRFPSDHHGPDICFSNLSNDSAAPPRTCPPPGKRPPVKSPPQIALNERRSVSPKCRPSRLRVRSRRSDSPSARGRGGLVRERRDSVLATDLAHHRLEADGVGHAGTRRARSLSHQERTTHQSLS